MPRESGRSRRLALFDRGNTRCPICLVPFSRTAVAKGSDATLEHAPPKALGGTIVCLTCRDCNAAASRKIDQAVAIAAKAATDRKAGRGIEVELDIFGTKHTAYLSTDAPMNPTHLAKIGRSALGRKFLDNHRSHDIRLLTEVKRGPDWDVEKGITITAKQSEPRHIAVSWLRSAYLLVFSLLGPSGYRYAESDATRSVRDQIAHPDRDLVPSLLCDFSPYPTPQDAIAIQNSAQPHCWIVKMGAIGVILPHGGSYEHFKEVIDLPDQIRSLKRLWSPTPFGRTPSIELSLRPDSGLHSMDLFSRELIIPVQQYERRCIIVNQQGPISTFIPSGPITRRRTSENETASP